MPSAYVGMRVAGFEETEDSATTVLNVEGERSIVVVKPTGCVAEPGSATDLTSVGLPAAATKTKV